MRPKKTPDAVTKCADLFGRERSVITKHLRNVFKEGELEEISVRAKYAHTAADGKEYQTQFYNLDAIISVGYRVNSNQGTRFRQWATSVLRDHIVKGYTVNEQRLLEESAKLQEMRQTMELLARTLAAQELVTDTGRDVLKVITDYAYALNLLDRYDHGTLAIEKTSRAVFPGDGRCVQRQKATKRMNAIYSAHNAHRYDNNLMRRSRKCLTSLS